MIVHIYHSYFRYPSEGGAIRSYHLARKLLEEGHEVTVITKHNILSGFYLIDNIPVRYFKVHYSNSLSLSSRVLSFVKYLFLALLFSFRNKSDLNYIISTPLTNGVIGLFGKWFTRTPYIFEVGDLWPDVPIEMGIIKRPIVKKTLLRFEAQCYSQALLVVALSPSMAEIIKEKVNAKTEVCNIPNMADCEFFLPNHEAKSFDIKSPMVIGYIGTLGIANGLELLIRLARECVKEKLPVQINIMGEGSRKKSLQQLVSYYSLSNVNFYSFGNYKDVSMLLSKSDAVYLSFQNIPILHTGSPNKFFDALASGKMVISNLGGWIGDLIVKYKCGLVSDSESVYGLAGSLREIIDDPEKLIQYQKKARKLAESHFDKEILLNRWYDQIHQSFTGL